MSNGNTKGDAPTHNGGPPSPPPFLAGTKLGRKTKFNTLFNRNAMGVGRGWGCVPTRVGRDKETGLRLGEEMNSLCSTAMRRERIWPRQQLPHYPHYPTTGRPAQEAQRRGLRRRRRRARALSPSRTIVAADMMCGPGGGYTLYFVCEPN